MYVHRHDFAIEPTRRISDSRRHHARFGWLAPVVVGVVLIASASGCAAPPADQGAASTTQSQAPADPQVEEAIQQVVQLASTEQVQALANRDPSVMSDTATGHYYRDLQQSYRELVSEGATSIQLTNLTWGAITVNGTAATANTVETWVTTFSNGTTDQSTDGNVYTLVKQGGSWLIQDDRQPTSASPALQVTPGQGDQPQAPPVPTLVPDGQDTSRNWSGYAATGGRYTGIIGTWTVPQVAASNGASGVGATWVGIGGVNTRDLIQAGTQDSGSGRQNEYQAWIELLPAASRQVPLSVVPGDSITVSIGEQGVGTNTWQIVMTNNTSGKVYQRSVHYVSSHSSVEWIEEAPSGRNGILPIDNFGKVSFGEATATANGETVALDQVGARPISLLNAKGQPLAVPSAIGSDGRSFSVQRTSAPATTTARHGLH